MADKLLAEWFWTDRWMGSSAFLLPLEARGLYREMLTQAWRRGASLPKEPCAIQRACGVTPEEWARCWPLVERYWVVEGDTIHNETQRAIYAESEAIHDFHVKGGKARAATAVRTDGRFAKGQQADQHCYHQADQPPSPSPSPSPDQTPEPSPERTRSSACADARALLVQRIWNENRGPLPKCEALNAARAKRLSALAREAGDDEALLASTVAAFASDPFMRERRYGVDTLTRAEHRAKWLDRGRNGYAPPEPSSRNGNGRYLTGEELFS